MSEKNNRRVFAESATHPVGIEFDTRTNALTVTMPTGEKCRLFKTGYPSLFDKETGDWVPIDPDIPDMKKFVSKLGEMVALDIPDFLLTVYDQNRDLTYLLDYAEIANRFVPVFLRESSRLYAGGYVENDGLSLENIPVPPLVH